MKNDIVIFTLNGCGHCHSLKTRLDDINIPYLDVEITQNEKYGLKLLNKQVKI